MDVVRGVQRTCLVRSDRVSGGPFHAVGLVDDGAGTVSCLCCRLVLPRDYVEPLLLGNAGRPGTVVLGARSGTLAALVRCLQEGALVPRPCDSLHLLASGRLLAPRVEFRRRDGPDVPALRALSAA